MDHIWADPLDAPATPRLDWKGEQAVEVLVVAVDKENGIGLRGEPVVKRVLRPERPGSEAIAEVPRDDHPVAGGEGGMDLLEPFELVAVRVAGYIEHRITSDR